MISNDHHAFTQLVNMHQTQIRSYALRLCRSDHALAEDIAQDTFLTAYRKIGNYENRGSFAGWLLKICYHNFLAHCRKHKNLTDIDVPEVEITDNTDMDILMEKSIAQLSVVERSVLTLHFTLGHTQQEIAQVMNLPLGTVKSHMLRGKTKLTAIINPEAQVGVA